MSAQQRFEQLMQEYREQFKRVNNEEMSGQYEYSGGYVRPITGRLRTPFRLDNLQVMVDRLKSAPSFEEQQILKKRKRYNEIDGEVAEARKEIKELEERIKSLTDHKEKLRKELLQQA